MSQQQKEQKALPNGSSSNKTFADLYAHLLTLAPPLTPPSHPTVPDLTAAIASLGVHPALEVALHLLNNDLPSAHFLVRHMHAAPAFEGMFLHGILHRIEGDFDNARAWYADVAKSEVYETVWPPGKDGAKGEDGQSMTGGKSGGVRFVDEVEAWVKRREGEESALEEKSVAEIKRVVEFVSAKFGTEVWPDATSEWASPSGDASKIQEQMILGDRGFRRF